MSSSLYADTTNYFFVDKEEIQVTLPLKRNIAFVGLLISYQKKQLKHIAIDENKTLTQIVQEALNEYLKKKRSKDRLISLFLIRIIIDKFQIHVNKLFSLLIISIAIFSTAPVFAQNIQDNFEKFDENARDPQEEFIDKYNYLYIKLQELYQEGGPQDMYEESPYYKEDCDEILENMDYFEKKEILNKYG